MISILCFGDSNTYGEQPNDVSPLPFEKNWPVVLQESLGDNFSVLKEGLSGRTLIAKEEKLFRNSLPYFEACILSHFPVDVIFLMLGTNDVKDKFSLEVEEIVSGFKPCLECIKKSYDNTKMPKVVIIIPPVVDFKNTPSDWGFSFESEIKNKKMVEKIKEFTFQNNLLVFDSNEYVSVSKEDGVHLNEESHKKLGRALSDYIKIIL